MNIFKWTALGVGGVVAIAHIGVLGHILKANNNTIKEMAERPQYPSINLPTGEYSSYDVNVDKDGYSVRYNANDPKVMTRTRTLELDKEHDNKGWFGKRSKGKLTKETFVTEEYTMHGEGNTKGGEFVMGEDGKKLSAAEIACLKQEGAGESTGRMVGASMTAGVAPVLTAIPYVGWLAAGWATLLGGNVGSELGGEVSTAFSDC